MKRTLVIAGVALMLGACSAKNSADYKAWVKLEESRLNLAKLQQVTDKPDQFNPTVTETKTLIEKYEDGSEKKHLETSSTGIDSEALAIHHLGNVAAILAGHKCDNKVGTISTSYPQPKSEFAQGVEAVGNAFAKQSWIKDVLTTDILVDGAVSLVEIPKRIGDNIATTDSFNDQSVKTKVSTGE